ncbi:Ubiquitin-associated domain (UBA) profile [Nakaseomyces glabratus]|nr:Ubiquitin-associated domain (UBA) profile [Nakaseomyces glabratus]KAH7590377.1 Ubiquitin-associated domain (UBA) profile [Nakaseomyces glabratus]
MQLTVTNDVNGEVYGPLELSGDMMLMDLVALLEVDCAFESGKQQLYFNGKELKPDAEKTLEELGIGNDDLIVIRGQPVSSNSIANSTSAIELDDDAYVEQFRLQLLSDSALRNSLRMPFADIDSLVNDPQQFKTHMGPVIIQRRRMQSAMPTNPYGIPDEEYKKLMTNPEDPEHKKRLQELQDKQLIDEQLRNALEYTPEVFAQVSMLYINMEINGHPVKAFVDSGAQMTIISPRLAEKTELKRFIDNRFIGEARGVGTGKILGRVHQVQVKIETQFIPCSFVVLDSNVDLLLGLDMLKRHQACIDLEKNVLRIAGTETKFLGEAEIPKGTSFDAVGNPQPPVEIKEPADHSKKKMKTSFTITPKVKPVKADNLLNNSSPMENTGRTFPEKTIKQLMDLGFSRQEVIQALVSTNGNAEFAASLLFQ